MSWQSVQITRDLDALPAAPSAYRGRVSRAEHYSERDRHLLDAAVAAFAVGGYYGTTTGDVAHHAGLSQPRMIQIFESKLAMFLRTHAYAGDLILDAMEAAASPPFRPEALGKAYVELVRTRPELLLVVFHAFSATREPRIAQEARRVFFAIRSLVRERAGADDRQTRDFMARGMLINASLAMQMGDSDDAEERDYLATVLGAAR